MGWWKTNTNELIGDGPLNMADDFLTALEAEYRNEMGRAPTIGEVVSVLKAALDAAKTNVTSDGAATSIVDIQVKTKAGPRKKLCPGDVFEVPLGKMLFAYGLLTPQDSLAEFFSACFQHRPSVSQLRKLRLIRVNYLIDKSLILEGQWPLMGAMAYSFEGFVPQQWLIGHQVACGIDYRNREGFIDTTGKLRKATVEEIQTLPPCAIYPQSRVTEDLMRLLKDMCIKASKKR